MRNSGIYQLLTQEELHPLITDDFGYSTFYNKKLKFYDNILIITTNNGVHTLQLAEKRQRQL